jgi:hypothetical protein
MTGELCNLPGIEIRENRFCKIPALGLETVYLLVDVDFRIRIDMAQFLDFRLQVGNRLFEIEKIEVHLLVSQRAPAKLSG